MRIKIIQKLIDKIRRKKKRKIEKYNLLKKGKDTVLLSNFSIAGGYEDKVRIGSGCMLACNLIFESDKGEIEIGDRCFINAGTNIISRSKIKFGNDITVAWGCTFYDHNSHSLDWRERVHDLEQEIKDYNETGDFIKNKNWDVVKSRPITIEDKAWIGMNCTILNGVTIGEGAIVGACSVVRENVEPWTVVAGNPAKVIRRIRHE